MRGQSFVEDNLCVCGGGGGGQSFVEDNLCVCGGAKLCRRQPMGGGGSCVEDNLCTRVCVWGGGEIV